MGGDKVVGRQIDTGIILRRFFHLQAKILLCGGVERFPGDPLFIQDLGRHLRLKPGAGLCAAGDNCDRCRPGSDPLDQIHLLLNRPETGYTCDIAAGRIQGADNTGEKVITDTSADNGNIVHRRSRILHCFSPAGKNQLVAAVCESRCNFRTFLGVSVRIHFLKDNFFTSQKRTHFLLKTLNGLLGCTMSSISKDPDVIFPVFLGLRYKRFFLQDFRCGLGSAVLRGSRSPFFYLLCNTAAARQGQYCRKRKHHSHQYTCHSFFHPFTPSKDLPNDPP